MRLLLLLLISSMSYAEDCLHLPSTLTEDDYEIIACRQNSLGECFVDQIKGTSFFASPVEYTKILFDGRIPIGQMDCGNELWIILNKEE